MDNNTLKMSCHFLAWANHEDHHQSISRLTTGLITSILCDVHWLWPHWAYHSQPGSSCSPWPHFSRQGYHGLTNGQPGFTTTTIGYPQFTHLAHDGYSGFTSSTLGSPHSCWAHNNHTGIFTRIFTVKAGCFKFDDGLCLEIYISAGQYFLTYQVKRDTKSNNTKMI